MELNRHKWTFGDILKIIWIRKPKAKNANNKTHWEMKIIDWINLRMKEKDKVILEMKNKLQVAQMRTDLSKFNRRHLRISGGRKTNRMKMSNGNKR